MHILINNAHLFEDKKETKSLDSRLKFCTHYCVSKGGGGERGGQKGLLGSSKIKWLHLIFILCIRMQGFFFCFFLIVTLKSFPACHTKLSQSLVPIIFYSLFFTDAVITFLDLLLKLTLEIWLALILNCRG